jgi:hypothetical protein
VFKESKSTQVKRQEYVCDFSDFEGIVHWKYASSGQTVNQHYYWDFFQCLREEIRRRYPQQRQPGLVDSISQHAGVHCFISAAIFGC